MIGITSSCSLNLNIALGSARKTDVSMMKVLIAVSGLTGLALAVVFVVLVVELLLAAIYAPIHLLDLC
jgi:hypothetical protein